MKAVSLAYHDVVRNGDFSGSGFPGVGAAVYKLDVEELRNHFQQMASTIRPILMDVGEFPSSRASTEIPLLLTFDDGGISAVNYIADLLETFGWRGHFFIPTDYINSPTFVTKEQIRELRNRGHLIGSHSCSHPPRISACTWEEMLAEWVESTAILSDVVGEEIVCASVPGGFYSRKVAEAASNAGIRALFTSEPTKRCLYVDNCLVLGRFVLLRGTSSSQAVGLASANLTSTQLMQYVGWNFKKIAKKVAGRYYERARKSILRNASK